jgi:hypothetical protein
MCKSQCRSTENEKTMHMIPSKEHNNSLVPDSKEIGIDKMPDKEL